MTDKERIAKLAKESTLNYGEFLASKERTLKTNAKIAANRKLYLDGLRKALQNVPLESFTDLVDENGVMVQRQEHRSFKAGYKAGMEELEKQNKSNKSR